MTYRNSRNNINVVSCRVVSVVFIYLFIYYDWQDDNDDE
jgi:hypothetical protein